MLAFICCSSRRCATCSRALGPTQCCHTMLPQVLADMHGPPSPAAPNGVKGREQILPTPLLSPACSRSHKTATLQRPLREQEAGSRDLSPSRTTRRQEAGSQDVPPSTREAPSPDLPRLHEPQEGNRQAHRTYLLQLERLPHPTCLLHATCLRTSLLLLLFLRRLRRARCRVLRSAYSVEWRPDLLTLSREVLPLPCVQMNWCMHALARLACPHQRRYALIRGGIPRPTPHLQTE